MWKSESVTFRAPAADVWKHAIRVVQDAGFENLELNAPLRVLSVTGPPGAKLRAQLVRVQVAELDEEETSVSVTVRPLAFVTFTEGGVQQELLDLVLGELEERFPRVRRSRSTGRGSHPPDRRPDATRRRPPSEVPRAGRDKNSRLNYDDDDGVPIRVRSRRSGGGSGQLLVIGIALVLFIVFVVLVLSIGLGNRKTRAASRLDCRPVSTFDPPATGPVQDRRWKGRKPLWLARRSIFSADPSGNPVGDRRRHGAAGRPLWEPLWS